MAQNSKPEGTLGLGQLLGWVLVLFLESEFLAVRNYELRTEIRAMLHLPLYHLTFSFLAFAIFLYALQSSRSEPLPLGPWRWSYALCHGCFSLVVASRLHFLAAGLAAHSVAWKLAAWGLVLLLFAGSWVAAILPPTRWISWIWKHGPWLATALLLAALSLGIMRVSNWLWHPLASGTLVLANGLLACVFDDVMVSYPHYALGTSNFQIVIEPGCSGYEGIGLVTMFTLTFLWGRRSLVSFPRALLLLPLGWFVVWILNGFRIATLVIIGTSFSAEVAMKGFHSQAGWLAFVVTSAALVLAVEHGGWFLKAAPAESHESDQETVYPASPYLLPLLALLLGTMLGSAFSTGFPLFYPVRILLAGAVLLAYYPNYVGLMSPYLRLPAVVTGLAVYVLWVALVPAGPAPTIWEQVSPALAWTWLLFRIVGSSLIIPLVEELAFRGYLLRRLQKSDFESVEGRQIGWPAWVLSSLAFGLLHQDVLAACLAGLAYAQLVRRGGSLGEAVLAHGITNFCICVQVLALGHWSLW